ncbi:hypothetical protein ACOKM3_14200 [Streptomyces sp. BH106]|uniref:hypothetical protein n=1 Tax=Streptomyces sp. BH106 TaxID=3410409 RepID=UPI003CF6A2E5
MADAADSVRVFNHYSRPIGEGWEFPSDAYDALGSLSRMVGMLDQALRQTMRPVVHTHEAGRLRIDGGGDPDWKLAQLVAARDDALAAASALTDAVQRMHNATSPMGAQLDDEETAR